MLKKANKADQKRWIFAVIQLNIVRFAVNTEYSNVIVCMQDCHGWMHKPLYTVTARLTCTLYLTFCERFASNQQMNILTMWLKQAQKKRFLNSIVFFNDCCIESNSLYLQL